MISRTLPLAAALLVLGLYTGQGPAIQAQQTHDHSAPATPPTTPPQTQAPAQAPAHDHSTATPAPADAGGMKMHAEMMAKMQAQDARLDTLVKAMDGATGPAKIEAMATVVRELVQAQKAMHQRMAEMHAHHSAGGGHGKAAH